MHGDMTWLDYDQNIPEAHRVLHTLSEHGKKEAVVLQDRIALCQAAQDLGQPGLAPATIKQNLLLLKDYHQSMPFEMRCSVVSQLLVGKLQEVMEAALTDIKKASALAAEWTEAIAFYLPTIESGSTVTVESIDPKKPLLAPLVKELEHQTLLDTDPSAAAFFGGPDCGAAPASKEDSDNEDFFGGASMVPANTSEDKDKEKDKDKEENQVKDNTRSWEARPDQSMTVQYSTIK